MRNVVVGVVVEGLGARECWVLREGEESIIQ
jgi:hypothetical protein